MWDSIPINILIAHIYTEEFAVRFSEHITGCKDVDFEIILLTMF